MSEYNNQNIEVYETATVVEPIMPLKKGFAIAALVLGITSIVPGCCCYFVFLGAILGVLAIIFAILFLNANKGILVSKGMAITGLVLGAIGVVSCLIIFIVAINYASSGEYDNLVDEFMKGIEQGVETE